MYMEVLGKMDVPEFRPRDGVKIATTDAEAKEQGASGAAGGDLMDVDAQCDQILKSLPKPMELSGFR